MTEERDCHNCPHIQIRQIEGVEVHVCRIYHSLKEASTKPCVHWEEGRIDDTRD